MPEPSPAPPDEYEEWLDRVRSTYESVSFTCVYRLGDRSLAENVGAQVIAGMIARPKVFRFFGLPYSARIGHLAEDRIAAARAGQLSPTVTWAGLLRRLRDVPPQQQHVFVLSYVRGIDIEDIAQQLGISVSAAQRLRADVLGAMREISGENPGDREDVDR